MPRDLAKLKLFTVSVSLNFDMAVFAGDEKEARKVAQRHWSTDAAGLAVEPDFMPVEMTEQRHTRGDCDLDMLPWAPEGTICESGCENPQRTLDEYLTERGLKG
jgi:hypothetical protein